jgi:endonuclease YncB( thermonuclease family)
MEQRFRARVISTRGASRSKPLQARTRQARYRRRQSWRIGRVERLLLVWIIAGVAGFAATGHKIELPQIAAAIEDESDPAFSLAFTPQWVTVVDGDTIRIAEEVRSVRLVGFNAPESRDPGCRAEGALGERAKTRLRQLVSASRLNFSPVACACKLGTEGTKSCNYGRACGTLRANGKDVGDILIAEGLAVPFHCRGTGCPPTPRPWCG